MHGRASAVCSLPAMFSPFRLRRVVASGCWRFRWRRSVRSTVRRIRCRSALCLGRRPTISTTRPWEAFLACAYRVTAESDRMGMRLDGTTLVHRPEKGADIASDATVPGSDPGARNGKPIVLLNDGQTVGGYPKIATVVSADLPRLAALPAGATVRFQAVSVVAAEAAARAAESDLEGLAGSIVPAVAAGELDLDAPAGNLLSGMVNATRPD